MEHEQFILLEIIEEMSIEKSVCVEPMRIARDIMNTNVKTLTLDHTVNQCLQFMKGHRVRHVPVVDLPYAGETKPYYVGVVSERDVLRLNTPSTGESSEQKIDQKALRQLLLQVVTRKPKSVSPQTPIQQVINVMTSNHVDMVPVLDGDDLAGIITTSDLMKLLFKVDKVIDQLCQGFNKDTSPVGTDSEYQAKFKIMSSWAFRTVQEIMTEEVVCLEHQDNLARAIEVMQTEEFRHIPVIDETGKFVGLVSDRDILRNLPYAGRRPPSPPKKFREHLFATDSENTNFLILLDKIMVRNAKYIPPSCKVHDAADILYKKRISCLPVIDENDRVQGIVTVTDLIRALLAVYEQAGKVGLIPSESGVCGF